MQRTNQRITDSEVGGSVQQDVADQTVSQEVLKSKIAGDVSQRESKTPTISVFGGKAVGMVGVLALVVLLVIWIVVTSFTKSRTSEPSEPNSPIIAK